MNKEKTFSMLSNQAKRDRHAFMELFKMTKDNKGKLLFSIKKIQLIVASMFFLWSFISISFMVDLSIRAKLPWIDNILILLSVSMILLSLPNSIAKNRMKK